MSEGKLNPAVSRSLLPVVTRPSSRVYLGPTGEKFGNPRLGKMGETGFAHALKKSRTPFSRAKNDVPVFLCRISWIFDATPSPTPQRALSFQHCGATPSKPVACSTCDAILEARPFVATSPSCARDGAPVSAERFRERNAHGSSTYKPCLPPWDVARTTRGNIQCRATNPGAEGAGGLPDRRRSYGAAQKGEAKQAQFRLCLAVGSCGRHGWLGGEFCFAGCVIRARC